MPSKQTYWAIGLMSGTSLDGIDAALIETDGEDAIRFMGASYHAYDTETRRELSAAARLDVPLNTLLRLEKKLTEQHVLAVEHLLATCGQEARDVDVIGFHGQTIRHLPDEGLTWQIGNPSLLAARTKIPVVSDFRRRDMAEGGQGAPLVPLFHQALMRGQEKPCMLLNLGGVANVTWLGGGDAIIAGDVGPGCGLLDRWVEKHTGRTFDKDGELALQGRVNKNVVNHCMQEVPFFSQLLPKSADRYDFNKVDVSNLSAADGAATLCAITAEAVKMAAKNLPLMPKTVWVTGGGAHHPVIMRELQERFAHVEKIDTLGQRADSMEAECFAWLGVRRLRGLPFSRPETTGARVESCGGVLTV